MWVEFELNRFHMQRFADPVEAFIFIMTPTDRQAGSNGCQNDGRMLEILVKQIRIDNSRGRDCPFGQPPAQIPASGITALGSCLR